MFMTKKNLNPGGGWQFIIFISLIVITTSRAGYAKDNIQFNTDVLDVEDRDNINLSHFSQSDYIMPGIYSLKLYVNANDLSEHNIKFYEIEDSSKNSQACLTAEIVSQLGLTNKTVSDLKWWHDNECLDESSISGMVVRGSLGTSSLHLSIPQANLEFSSVNWDPPSSWDEGIPGILVDYNFIARAQYNEKNSDKVQSISGNGTAGLNLDAWRIRADWQTRYSNESESLNSSHMNLNKIYAYRALPSLRSKLTIGESYLNSNFFDNILFSGASIISDDNMLPPNLRGYAPEVVGVARTNAKVIISQLGRVLYETQVAAGPFRIQDLSQYVSGELEVRIEEQDGKVEEFRMNTATIPYLTRPGAIRFKASAGRPWDLNHNVRGPLFSTGELAWGINNGWSVYGALLSDSNYRALSLGLGKDLMVLGAMSFDATESYLSGDQNHGSLSGGSYRLSYSKNFVEYDSQITFAGYRFSEKNYMSLSDYLSVLNQGIASGNNKEMYTISLNKRYNDFKLSTNLNYSHQTYWDRPANDRYNFTLSKYLDLGSMRDISISFSLYRNRYNENNEDGLYLSLSVPFQSNKTLTYSMSKDNYGMNSHRMGYSERIDSNNSYQMNVGTSKLGNSLSGFYNHAGDYNRMSGNVSYQNNSYTAAGISLQGGMTLTPKGGAFHRVSSMGSTRMLVDTHGIADVPIRGSGSTSKTNYFGKAVVGDVNSYYRSKASIDLNELGDNVEALNSVVEATFTEGAIGFRQFNVIAGQKIMAIIKLADGKAPPFGATVTNEHNQETGIVTDGGNVYLSGINPGEVMDVNWSGGKQCRVNLPNEIQSNIEMNNLLLPCK